MRKAEFFEKNFMESNVSALMRIMLLNKELRKGVVGIWRELELFSNEAV